MAPSCSPSMGGIVPDRTLLLLLRRLLLLLRRRMPSAVTVATELRLTPVGKLRGQDKGKGPPITRPPTANGSFSLAFYPKQA